MLRHEIEIRMSEIRGRLNGDAEVPAAEATALQSELVGLEVKFQEAVKAEAEKREEAKAAEVAPLADRIECRRFVQAAMNDERVDGAEREIQQELKLPDTAMPFQALDPGIESVEARQDVVTPVAASVIHKPLQSLLRRVFRRTDAAWLGVRMPSVAPGTPNYPVMTGGTTGEMKAAGAAVNAAAAAFTGTTIEPTRGTARYLYRVEDAAKFANLEDVLRGDLREVLGQLLDDQVVSGNGVAPNISGFINHAAARVGATPAAVATIGSFDTSLADGIDGLYAYDAGGVRHLIGVDTQKFLMKTRIATGEQPTFSERWTANGARWRASSRVAAIASTKQNAYRFRPAEFRGIAPIWQGINLIRDPYSGAAKGEVALTVLMLFGFDVLRGAPQTVEFKLA